MDDVNAECVLEDHAIVGITDDFSVQLVFSSLESDPLDRKVCGSQVGARTIVSSNSNESNPVR